jgi:hypothetical protein
MYTHDQAKTPFPKLPLEIREKIYTFLICPDDVADGVLRINPGYGRTLRYPEKTPPWVPLICHFNETTRIEAGLTLLREAEFEIGYDGALNCFEAFLRSFPEKQGFAAVRSIYLPDFWFSWSLPTVLRRRVDLLEACPNLQEVRMTFAKYGLLKARTQTPSFWSTQKVGFVSIEEVINDHFLRNITGIRSLKRIVLVVDQKFREQISSQD